MVNISESAYLSMRVSSLNFGINLMIIFIVGFIIAFPIFLFFKRIHEIKESRINSMGYDDNIKSLLN